MKLNKKGFAIMIAMVLVVLITLVAFVILSFIMPFARNIKGIENTTIAYYNGYKGIEDGLYHIKIRTNLTTESGRTNISNGSGYKFNTFSSGTIIPQLGYGNSEFDKDYNIISINDPIQLEIGKGMVSNWGSVDFIFKVPDFDKNYSTIETLSGDTIPIINWLLLSENDTLIASGSYITKNNKINDSNGNTSWNIKDMQGVTLNGSGKTFSQFYQDNNCNLSGSGCILKMSVINDLFLTNGSQIPYLEYKITFLGSVPDRYSRITSYGVSKGFQKKLDVRVLQQTVNSAFDFTVFQ